MVKFISKLIGSRVLLFQEKLLVGEVTHVLIDPKDGAFIGIEIFSLTDSGQSYIPASEIKGFGQGIVLVKDVSSLSAEDDVVRIKNVLLERPKIIGAKVYYEEGSYVGRVEDATINIKLLALEKLYINPKFSKQFFTESVIVASKMIVKIEPKRITIKNSQVKARQPKLAPAPTPISE
jgi:sporulation protein YlmC with PRC-barrel domain